MEKVKIEEDANIMVLMLKRIMERNLQDENLYNMAKKISSKIVIKTNKMAMTIHFNPDFVLLKNGGIENPDVYVYGELKDFLDIAAGKFISVSISFLKRKLKIKGNILSLVPLIKILKV